jgi:hypothetical protein
LNIVKAPLFLGEDLDHFVKHTSFFRPTFLLYFINQFQDYFH